jgi:hypothetical protein
MAQIIISKGTAAATPSAGKVTLYAKTDGLLYAKDDAGVETILNNASGTLTSSDIGGTVQAYNANTAMLNAVQTWASAQTFDAALIITDEVRETPTVANTSTAYTIDITSGTLFDLTLTGNCTFTFPTATAGRQFTLLLKQDATGSRTITWPSSVRWAAGSAPTITTTASKTDVISFVADGTYWLGFVGGQNYTRA